MIEDSQIELTNSTKKKPGRKAIYTPEELQVRNRETKKRWKGRNKEHTEDYRQQSVATGKNKKWQKTYSNKHKDEINEKSRKAREADPERRRIISNKSQSKVREIVKADPLLLAWSRERGRIARLARRQRRVASGAWAPKVKILQTLEQKRLKKVITGNLRSKIKTQGGLKPHKTLEYLGCSIVEFMAYFEQYFEPGMAWGNYGEWEIDHIIPGKLFDLTKVEEQNQCFHHTNLQPLWMSDNRKKSCKVPICNLD